MLNIPVVTEQDMYGVQELRDLLDVDVRSVQSGQVLKWNGLKWINDVINIVTDYVPLSLIGSPNGVASLGPDGLVPNAELPPLAITRSFVVASEQEQLGLIAEEGDVAIRSDISRSFIHNGGAARAMSDWNELLVPPDSVISVAGKTGVINLSKSDVGLGTVDNTSDLSKPISLAAQSALDGKLSINGDGSLLMGLTKTQVGLGSVDNTSDIDKPISSAVQTALNAKVTTSTTINGYALTGNISITKSDVGLGNADNTSDVNKPISSAVQTALNAKVSTSTTVNSKALSASITLTKSDIGLGSVDNTSDVNKPISSAVQTALNAKVATSTTVNSKALTASITLTKSDIGLGSVDNTSDVNKPISSAMQSALDAKAALAHSHPESAITFTDILTGNASATSHGFCPKLPNNTTTFLRGDGAFAPASGLSVFSEVLKTAIPNDVTNIAVLSITGGTADVDIALVPKGTGAVLASAPDSTIAGGDKRGIYAVDFQHVRDNITQVASGEIAVICGGGYNTASNGYATVCGGGYNKATGEGSSIGGGYTNQAAGLYSTISGGWTNTASGSYSCVIGGYNNQITSAGSYAVIAGGYQNSATKNYAAVLAGAGNTSGGVCSATIGGQFSTASGNMSVVMGSDALAIKYGQLSHGGFAITSAGDCQHSRLVAHNVTTDLVTVDLFLDGTSSRITLPANTSWIFEVDLVGRRTDADNENMMYSAKGGIRKNSTNATTSLVGSVASLLNAKEGLTGTGVAITADTTNGALKISVTGEAGKTINWVATIYLTETAG